MNKELEPVDKKQCQCESITLNEHLRRMFTKASIMCWTIKETHKRTIEILKKYGIKTTVKKKGG